MRRKAVPNGKRGYLFSQGREWSISEENEEDLSMHGGAERLGAHRGAREAFPLCLPLPAHSGAGVGSGCSAGQPQFECIKAVPCPFESHNHVF